VTEASLQIEELTSALPTPNLWGAFKVKSSEGNCLELVGWALGTVSEVKEIVVVTGGAVVASAAPSLPRAELAEEFRDRQSAATCGFEVAIEARGKGESTLELRAVLEDGTEVAMGEIRVLAPTRRWGNVFRRG
jgi:hypothetical protein